MENIHKELILINRKLYLAIGFLLGFGLASMIFTVVVIYTNNMVLPF